VDGQEVPKRVLILCTGNSCRSQIAEGLWRALAGDRWEVASAGARPAGTVHPLAVEAMQEIGIDISSHRSKHVDEFAGQNFDLLVTVCDSARESCPTLPRVKRALVISRSRRRRGKRAAEARRVSRGSRSDS
jgi:arsenate reductase